MSFSMGSRSESNQRLMRTMSPSGLSMPPEEMPPPAVKTRKLSNWLNRSLPFDDETQDGVLSEAQKLKYNKGEITIGRIIGSGLNQTFFAYWRELFDRDERAFLKCLLRRKTASNTALPKTRVTAFNLKHEMRQLQTWG
eukprot:Gregarina_sp_Poly_1__5582@NODE_2949_length_1516_cov_40_518979_g1860_i0_p2_GENE_NODE_2949_length_1516_cov_40_518979_g1860_i0NODE_2949_length_1516_cov_40_518979_g1860_i0_p2_ORF_typecomplete_len139_score20_55_NODE_2949_length_1516_cov_40_518979_g1860_i07421158